MNNIRFEFSSVHEETLINSLAEFLGTSPVNGALRVPAQYGRGIIVRKELDNGLVLVCWDFQLGANVTFAKQTGKKTVGGRSFIINYLIAADNIVMESPSLKKKFYLRSGLNILLLPDDADLDFHILAGTIVKVVSISVKPEWLMHEYEGFNPAFTEYLYQLICAAKPSVFMESATADEFKTLNAVLNNTEAIPAGVVGLKPRIMMVLADFLTRIFQKPITEITESRLLHFIKMQEVEAMLRDYIEKELPDIDSIARSINLSISTLKRHFKIIYGKGVYEYYLSIKMEHAKRLLIESDISVNEVAYRLNYEKASSFIESFKKQHGFCPGEIRKKAS